MQILSYTDNSEPAKRLAKILGIDYQKVAVHHFPDGESKVTLPPQLDTEIIIYRSLDRPNDKLVELLLTCNSARQQGVKKITLIAPYLCYMRQDTAFHPGEVISQQVIGQWLGEMVDALITIDPHLHRTHDLQNVIPNTQVTTLSATPLMAKFLGKRPSPPLLLGPDSESEQWVKQIAELANLEWTIATKVRHGDLQVQINLPDFDFQGRNIVIVDDVASTGHTLANAARQLKAEKAEIVSCLITHALFVNDAEQTLANARIDHVWSTDSIRHDSNIIHLAELLADAIS